MDKISLTDNFSPLPFRFRRIHKVFHSHRDPFLLHLRSAQLPVPLRHALSCRRGSL